MCRRSGRSLPGACVIPTVESGSPRSTRWLLAGRDAREAIPVLERMRDDHDAEVRKQAEAACKRIREDTTGHRI